MPDTNSTAQATQSKPAKPSPDFPLFAHATGRWAKKIKGQFVYFGPWADPDGALKAYKDFLAGKQRKAKRKSRQPAKPKRPYSDFPLFPHSTLRWAKKIKGRMCYFGAWANRVKGELVRVPGDGWQEALDLYKEQAKELHAGRTPRPKVEGFTLADACNAFLTFKRARVDTGELSARSFGDYLASCKRLTDFFRRDRLVVDLTARDFEEYRGVLAKRLNMVSLGNEIQRIRCLFKYAFESGLIAAPVRLGPGFARPSKKSLRIARAKRGERMLEAVDLRRIIDAAGVPLKAFVLLALNCGYGNSDIACLPLKSIDLERGWINFPRPKTGSPRRCPLWAETLEAVRAALDVRTAPTDADDNGLAFLTRWGGRWVKAGMVEADGEAEAKVTRDDAIAKEFVKVLDELDLKRPGVSFYTLRHVFRTVADEALDTAAAGFVMGHVDQTMAASYVERIGDTRLQAVVDHVHKWLFAVDKADQCDKGPA